ncbi:MAG: arylsulfotransferase family protein [bacterium]
MSTQQPTPQHLGLPLLFLAGMFLLLGAGCSKSVGRDNAADTPKPNVQRLQSLPYAGSTPAKPDDPDGVIAHDAERSCPGYNLYTIYALGTAELIDADGNVIRSWSAQGEIWMHCELLPEGDLLVVGAGTPVAGSPGQDAHLDDATRFVKRYDWNGERRWRKSHLGHHDVEVTPDGKILLLALEYRHFPQFDPRNAVRDDILLLLEPDGSSSESYSLMEAVGRNNRAFPLYRLDPTEESGNRFIDLLHANSVEWMRADLAGSHPLYDPANVLVCFRHQNRVALFNWRERQVVWSWGHDELYGPHDAQLLASGNLLVFDNGLSEQRSRIVEMDPRTGKVVWQYVATPPGSFYTLSKGSAQRLPNGNTLAAESDKGRALEVTPAGEKVWEFVCPHFVDQGNRAAIVHIKRYPEAFLAEILAGNPQ